MKSGFGSVAGVFVGKPANVVSSNDDLGLGAGFGEESSRLQCALYSADDGDAAALERPEIAVVDRVRDERRRKLGEANCGGRQAKGTMPAATTTRSA